MMTSMPNNKQQNKNNKKRQRQHPQTNNTQHQKQQQQHKLKFVVLLLKILVVGGCTFYVINSFYILLQHRQQQQQHDQVSQQHSQQQPQQQQHSNKNDRPLLLSSSKSKSSTSLSSNLSNKTMTMSTSTSTLTLTSTSTNKNETQNSDVLYFRYDQVGPKIETGSSGSSSIGSSSIAPKTHFLSSIPKKYRLLTSDLLGGGRSLDVVDVDVGLLLGLSKLPDGSSDGSLESEKLKKKNQNLSNKNHHKLLLEDYASQKKNVWPQKLHLYEMNPSIAKLPNKYRQDPIWHTYFNNLNNNNSKGKGNGDSMPLYVSVYRITHWNNCYDGTINVKMYGGSWENVLGGKSKFSNVSSMIPQTDYLGLALLDSNLNIVMDITMTLQTVSTVKFFPSYNDYRLFNLRNKDGEEQLYLTSVNHIAPIELSLVTTSFGLEEVQDQDQSQGEQQQQQQQKQSQSPRPPKGYIQIPNAFNDDDVNNADVKSNVTTSTALSIIQLQVFIRKYSSCPIGKTINKRAQSSKNLLYFQNTHYKKQNNTNTNNDVKLLFQPRWNPNEVFQNINLNSKCRLNQKDTKLKYSTILDPQEKQAREKFETVEKLFYPTYHYDELFVQDRGSACCIDIYVNTTINSDTNNTNHEYDDENKQQKQTQNKQLQKYQLLKVAVVHPKTKYPGNNLPLGITPNTYLSRFIAFLPEAPYTILYKSNMFCLPYPTIRRDDDKEGDDNINDNTKDNDENNGSNLNPLTYMKMIPLEFGSMNETAAYSNCPRIHFVTGMIDKIDPIKATDNGEDEDNNNDFSNNDGSVILSYGVSDCLSRFIEIKKSEIIRMLI